MYSESIYDVVSKALRKNGYKAQRYNAIEKLQELQEVMMGEYPDLDDLADEIADVLFSLCSVIIYYGLEWPVEERMLHKADRLRKRLDGENV